MEYKSILSMVEAVRNNNVEKFLEFIQGCLPDDEKELGRS